MSNVAKKRIKVPTGKTRFVSTKQMKPTKNGFIGFETVWEPMQKVAKYKKPKTP